MVNPYGKYDELVKSQHHPSTVRSAQALRLTVRPEALEGTNGSLRTGLSKGDADFLRDHQILTSYNNGVKGDPIYADVNIPKNRR